MASASCPWRQSLILIWSLPARPIAAICRRLDGLPLAIELAAARIRLLSPEAMLDRLESSLDLLTGGARDLPERQRTMRAAIEWSDTLLDDSERALFRSLGVFSGGFTIDAAEEVCAQDANNDVLSGIASLLSKSLLHHHEPRRTEGRFRMLETVREYALDRLESAGEMSLKRERHATWAIHLAERARVEVHGPGQLESLARGEDEHDNFRAALAWFAEGDAERGLRLAVALAPFWRLHSHLAEGRRWLAHGLAAAVAPTDVDFRGEALLWSGLLAARAADDVRAKELLEQADGVAAEVGDRALRGRARSGLGWLAITRGSISDGVSNCREAVELLHSSHEDLARKLLQEVTVPRAKSLAGFKSGTWLRALHSDRGMSVLLFDSEDDARAAADQIRSQGPPEGSPVIMESVDAFEVLAQA